MPIGVAINTLSVLVGGFLGCLLGKKIPERIHHFLPTLFGYCAIGIGIQSIAQPCTMTLVVLTVLVGFCIGNLLNIEKRSLHFFGWVTQKVGSNREATDLTLYITVVALFCCSGFGWSGALQEGINGNAGILLSKSVMDCFTALLFGAILGKCILVVPVFQGLVMLLVFFAGKLAAPFVTAASFSNLSVCGGIITIATGLRVAKIKDFPVIDLLPVLLLIIPVSILLVK